MKKEYLELKQYSEEYKKVKREFDFNRDLFNYGASALYLFVNETSPDYEEGKKKDAYSCAKDFCSINEAVMVEYEDLVKEYPDVSRETIKDLLCHSLVNNWDEDKKDAWELASTYMTLKDLNFDKVQELEEKTDYLAGKVKDLSEVLVDSTITSVKENGKKAGKAVVDIVKPYAEVAKGQIAPVAEKAKDGINSGINKGTKKMIKVLEKVANKTETNN